jgi:lipopolysaccharide transport system ATP-binding protein
MTTGSLPVTRRGVALSCQGVSKDFAVLDEGSAWRLLLGTAVHGRSIRALDGVSLVVPKGKFVGVLGRNGAGKSTLLRVLGGVYDSSAGRVESEGSISGLFELGGIGNHFLTGREFATRRLMLGGAKTSELPRLVDDIHDFSELGADFDHRIVTYSSGMGARLYFAVATAVEYDIYLIDEILSVGDEHFQAKCWRRLRERFSTNGASGVLVTHDWSSVLKLCEEAHILKNGRVAMSGRADRIIQAYLQVPKSTNGSARLCEDNPQSFNVRTGGDAVFILGIVLDEDLDVTISYSIEALRIGFGWEIVLIENFIPAASRKGRHSLTIVLPRCPLTPGRYVLNLFLTSPRATHGTPNFRIYDSNSWTHGEGVQLLVEGRPAPGVANIPLRWHGSRE